MIEGEPRSDERPKVEFGQPPKVRQRQATLFPSGDDLPLFSGTPQQVADRPFLPEDRTWKQMMLPAIPGVDYDAVRAKDRELQRRRHSRRATSATDLLTADQEGSNEDLPGHPLEESRHIERHSEQLREVLIPYLNMRQLRRLVASGSQNLHEAITSNNPPQEVLMLLDVLAAILAPVSREQIANPHDVAALLMVDMGYLQQEQLRVVCLNTKNHVQKIHIVYQGNLNSTPVRIAEVFREPLCLNSAAIIAVHNHPSGVAEPSPEDILVTRQLVEAGKLLDCEVLDHLIIGQGRWVSLRERGLGFELNVRSNVTPERNEIQRNSGKR